jgi:hypothetical protein
MTHDYDDPPLIEGGQGRSAQSVRDSGLWCLYLFCGAVVALAVLLWTGGADA